MPNESGRQVPRIAIKRAFGDAELWTGFERKTVNDNSVNRNSALVRIAASLSGLYGISSVDHCSTNETKPRQTLNAKRAKKIAEGTRKIESIPKLDREIKELNIANSFCAGLNVTISDALNSDF
jgi:hypothetical protein